MATLIKDAEIQGLISPLTIDERQQLEANLLAVWPQPDGPPILLDGHNRFDICTAHGLPYETIALAWITSREEAINWVIANQLGRRNLTEEQKSYLRGKRYNLEKKGVGHPFDHSLTMRELRRIAWPPSTRSPQRPSSAMAPSPRPRTSWGFLPNPPNGTVQPDTPVMARSDFA